MKIEQTQIINEGVFLNNQYDRSQFVVFNILGKMFKIVYNEDEKLLVKKAILDKYNTFCNEEIQSKYTFKNHQVWLSQENQFNYKAALDLAVQTGGENLPVTFKLGTDEEPVFQEFKTVEELKEFVSGMLLHINNTLKKYWKLKEEIDWKKYKID